MNYIEIQNEYTDEDGDLNRDVRWAVRPTPDEMVYKDGTRAKWLNYTPWQIEPGQPLSVYDRKDIEALRKLLDAIEAELEEK